jgi:hypothetical protein
LAKWLNDPEVDRDAKTFFKNRGAMGFYVEDTLASANEASKLTEVRFGGRPGNGLCAAWLLNGISLSLRSHAVWNTTFLGVTIREITDSDAVEETEKQVPHVCRADHFGDHAGWLSETQRSMIRSGADLLARANTLFPSIEICGRALRQIEDLTGGEQYFEWVLSCLVAGNRLVSEWSGGEFPHDQLPGDATGESASVWDRKEFINQRYFNTLAEESKLFEYHMKNKSHNIRIHYLPDAARRVLMIGYVGKHLPTKQHPT